MDWYWYLTDKINNFIVLPTTEITTTVTTIMAPPMMVRRVSTDTESCTVMVSDIIILSHLYLLLRFQSFLTS